MTRMLEGFKYLYSGVNWKQRQLTLFSICGITGLFFALYSQDMTDLTIWQKIIFTAILALYGLFVTGFEILFMHERRIPDTDLRSFKLALNKIPFIVFAAGIPVLLINMFTQYQYLAFSLSIFLAIPLTMMQAGFSYDYNNNDYLKLFKKFTIKDYFFLIITKLYLTIVPYLITYILIFLIFFVIGIIIAFTYKGDISSLGLTISGHQVMIVKLSNFISNILLYYALTISTLVWDYELITTYEKTSD